MDLWLDDPSARDYAAGLEARGKRGIIACALAHSADKIAYAFVRDQASHDLDRWISPDRRPEEDDRTIHDSGRWCHPDNCTKDRLRRRIRYGGHPRVLRRD